MITQKVSIIGSANGKGIKDRENLLNKGTWQKICETVENYISTNVNGNWSRIHLVSGGAAWCDHVAVYLYFLHPDAQLTLHFPYKWDFDKKQFIDNGKNHWATNPGRTANKHHQSFQKKIGQNTFHQLQKAIDNGAKIYDHYTGFHDRNSAVASCDYLIAMTFFDGPEPNGGGTWDTWKKSQCTKKIHFTIK